MIEFVVAIVAIVVLFAGLLQICRLCALHTETMTESRAEAGAYAMSDTYVLEGRGPDYIQDWKRGADRKRYSRDDRSSPADPSRVAKEIVAHAHPGDLAARLGMNEISALRASKYPVNEYMLVRGYGSRSAIDLVPVIRRLVYADDSVDVECETWLAWTRGIY
ncbi:MAG: hypothetical protein JXR37_03125 [Kiritimatiellae bacterium]|nr:hypothetical protein [Kiritimatiellia bacterium]